MDDKLWWAFGWILLNMLRTVCCLARVPVSSRNGIPIEFIRGAKGSIMELNWPDMKKKGSLNLGTRKDFGEFVPRKLRALLTMRLSLSVSVVIPQCNPHLYLLSFVFLSRCSNLGELPAVASHRLA